MNRTMDKNVRNVVVSGQLNNPRYFCPLRVCPAQDIVIVAIVIERVPGTQYPHCPPTHSALELSIFDRIHDLFPAYTITQ